jgi:RecA/RadA recombinase
MMRGSIVAVVGVDGSGKSTLAQTLVAALQPDVDAQFIYFGSGDGPSSWFRWPLKVVRGLLLPSSIAKESRSASESRRSWIVSAARCVWALTLAVEKVQKSRKADRARRHGTVVVCDRFPQVQFPGGNDGPLLDQWANSRSSFKRWLATLEGRAYQSALRVKPDLVVKLELGLDVAMSRRPGLDPAYLQRRMDLITSLDFGTHTIAVDATQPAEAVRSLALEALLGAQR